MDRPFLLYVTNVTFLIPPVVGIHYWKTQNTPMKFFIVFCVYTLVHTATEIILGLKGINNLFLLHYYTLIEFESFCILFYLRITPNSILRQIIFLFGVLFFAIWMYDTIYLRDPMKFDDFVSSISQTLLIVLSLVVFQQLVKTSPPITQYAIFWIALAVLLYSSGTIIISSMSNRLLEMGTEYFKIAWHLNWIFTIIANLFFARSFLCRTF